MKVSELIEQLSDTVNDYGDLDLVVIDSDGREYEFYGISIKESVKVYEDKRLVVIL